MVNVVIIGGGQGGTSILKAWNGVEEFKIIGLCDVDPAAPGIKQAMSEGIPVYADLMVALRQPDIDLIIEATGSEKVRELINTQKPKMARVIDSDVANIVMMFTEAHDEVVKKARSKKEAFKTSAQFLVQTYGKEGVVYFTTDLEEYDFVESKNIEMPGIRVGKKIDQGGDIEKCILSKQAITDTVDRSVYAIRLHVWVAPLFSDDDQGELIGTYGVFVPQLHVVGKAFDNFAPIVAESQPEGAVIIATDLQQILYRYGSEKFDMQDLKVGAPIIEGDVAWKTIKENKKVVVDFSSKRYGNVRMTGIPLYDEETGKVVGAFGIAIPRNLVKSLQDMATRLNANTQEMASVMQEIAASAGEINLTESQLAEKVIQVQQKSNQINEILSFIKSVADQTKMLGLNAAIEAARAGEHGRGFGVVAEEIRRLSDQSKQTAEQIGKLTGEIDDRVTQVVNASDGTV